MENRVLVFEHIPKSGGSTVLKVLRRQYPGDRFFNTKNSSKEQIQHFRQMGSAQRAAYDLIAGHGAMELLPLIERPVVTVTMLRDPIDRFVSQVYYLRRKPTKKHADAVHGGLADIARTKVGRLFGTKLVQRFSGIADIDEIMKDPQKALLAAKEALGKFDIVGVLDRFDDTLLMTWEKMNWRGVPFYARANIGTNRPRKPLSTEEREAIAEASYLDLELYHWSVDRFAKATDVAAIHRRRKIMRLACKAYQSAVQIKGYVRRFVK